MDILTGVFNTLRTCFLYVFSSTACLHPKSNVDRTNAIHHHLVMSGNHHHLAISGNQLS